MNRPRRIKSESAQSPLETYLREINETALLSAEEEKELAHRIANGENDARDRMVRGRLLAGRQQQRPDQNQEPHV